MEKLFQFYEENLGGNYFYSTLKPILSAGRNRKAISVSSKNILSMSKTRSVTLKQQKSVKKGSASFAVSPGISFEVMPSGDSQPQASEIEKPFLNAVNADSAVGSISSSDFKIYKS